MDLQWLRTFVTAAQTGNFSRTAERLHLAQPTVSVHIQKLEQTLGVALFERTGRSVQLTPAGRRYLNHARAMVEADDAAREDLFRWQQGYAHTVRVAASPLVATTVLPDCIRRFTRDRPDVEFAIQVMESVDIAQAVMEGLCDFGLSRQGVEHPHLVAEALYADPVVFIAPADVGDVDGVLPAVDELLEAYPVLTHNHPEYWDDLLLRLRQFHPLRTLRVSQVHVTVQWVVERLGVSFLPASTVRRELLRGTVLEVPFPHFALPVAHTRLVCMPGALRGVAAEFAEHVRAYCRARTF
ncbi:LysR family transcriptional regulator [Alicyclobacillus macrosporangiidus]|uniref:LysR family transcriptional regulator, repressor for citA n=1 Tax=Alicyclobacillus macrosporangiidus TaxID=392015 RepID=A0A1I7KS56_9BACL|nr:LysR family transcriptional regulator [Alicyclobacillus macrosporangiidus]SFV00218.1 LysR family transcriptional regulator, repressor for citA [Alicyclobacillus macrosporangiidus]